MAKVKVIKKLLKGIGSLFKERGEEVPALFKTPTKDPEFGTRVFFNNLLEEFGEKQVKESVEITRNAWKKKQFFPGGPQGDRFEDDLVNLLETRYMSSDRLQAHPLSFNRRGAGAADRYKIPKLGQQIEMGNKKRTDLPGGPGDPDLYKNRWGEMSDNVNPITKKKIYDKPPSIIDEHADEVVDNIKTNKNVSPEDIDFAYDRGMMGRIRAAADEQLDKVRLQSKQMNAAANQITMMTNRMEEFAKKGDWENAEKIQKAIEEYRLKVQSNKGTIIDDFPILIDPTRKPNAKGGRVGLFRGGLSSLLRMINPALERKMVKTGPFQTGHRADAIADMEQIKNITRNEATDLEDIYQLEDMIQNSPRYNDKMKTALLDLIDYEKFRANALYDNPKLQKHMKADPEGTESYLRWLYRSEGSDSGFNMGGRVGMFTGGIPLAYRGIGYLWRAIKEAAKLAKVTGRTGGKYKIGDIDYLFKRSPRSKFTKEDAAGVMNPRWGRKYGLFGRRLPRVITKEQENMMKLLKEFGEDYADGGRVGMFAGGKLLGEGIMQAAKLAQKGIRPWGSKQIHRQKVTNRGASNFDHIEEVIRIETDANIDAGDLRALVQQYESILSGKELGLLNTPQREKILKILEEGMAKTSDKFDTKGITRQLRDYYDLGKIKGTAKILPFKPRTKKAMGGQIGVGSLFRSK